MSQPASAAPSRKKTVISLLVLAALTGIIVLLFKDNRAVRPDQRNDLSPLHAEGHILDEGLAVVADG